MPAVGDLFVDVLGEVVLGGLALAVGLLQAGVLGVQVTVGGAGGGRQVDGGRQDGVLLGAVQQEGTVGPEQLCAVGNISV